MQRGFGIMEIVLALGIFLIVMLAVFQYSGSLQRGIGGEVHIPGIEIYRYGENFCNIHINAEIREDIDVSHLFSTSTPITSMHVILENRFLLTADSASTTEPDIFLMDASFNSIESKDVGPGIQDSVLIGSYIYVANTSVNSHVKSFEITDTITETGNIRINSLSQSTSMPRRLSVYGTNLILGAEKSSAGGELFFLPISTSTGLIRDPIVSLELGGQAHQASVFQKDLLVSNSADPELHLYRNDGTEISNYDAPLTLGNGKSVLSLHPYIIFGRTLGSGELSLLEASSSAIEALDTKRTQGTVDALLHIPDANFLFLAFTSNTDKEIQFWKVTAGKRLVLEKSLDVPARITAHACGPDTLYAALLINEKQHVLKIW